MLQRLWYLLVAGMTALIGITLMLRTFSDILPVASTEPQSVWRFEVAYLLTSVQWIVVAVVALTASSILVLLYRSSLSRSTSRESDSG